MHIRFGTLEKYSLGQMAKSGVIRVEKHLLICDSCRNMLDRVEALTPGRKRRNPQTEEMAPPFFFYASETDRRCHYAAED